MLHSAHEQIAIRFGRNLRAERDRLSLTQARLAELAGLDLAAIERLENGTRTAGVDTMFRLVGALGTRPAVLLRGIGWDPATKEFWTAD